MHSLDEERRVENKEESYNKAKNLTWNGTKT